MLARVGWAGALLFNERTGRLVDGHARKDLPISRDKPLPVLVGSWSDEQERLILLTLDPIGAMAETDADQLEELLSGVSTDDDEFVGDVLDRIRTAAGLAAPRREPEEDDEEKPAGGRRPRTVTCPNCGAQWVEGGAEEEAEGDGEGED